MSTPLKLFRVAGVSGTYEVRRDGILLGCVSAVEVVEESRSPTKARLRKVRRWGFQRIGAAPAPRLLYTTRKKAAEGLATVYDMLAPRPEGR